jgi:hypothetical protein
MDFGFYSNMYTNTPTELTFILVKNLLFLPCLILLGFYIYSAQSLNSYSRIGSWNHEGQIPSASYHSVVNKIWSR